MRFGIYIRSVESARGAERVAVNVARGLAERGHQIDFLVEEDGARLLDELRWQHTNVTIRNLRRDFECTLANKRSLARAFAQSLLSAPLALLRSGDTCIAPVARLLWKNEPPVAALHGYLRTCRPQAILSLLNYPNVVLLLARLLSPGKTRFVVSVHNTVSVAAAQAGSKWVRSVPRLMRRYFRKADGIVAVSFGVAEDVAAITGLPRDRITTIYNPIYRPELSALAEAEVEHSWLLNGNEPIVLGAGKLKPQKDFPTLLKAFAKVRAERSARLIILGTGDEEAGLRALASALGASDSVDYPACVRNPFAFYRRASVFVLSSVWEGLPTVLIEAMACGCPVVSTDCPSGPREILDGGRFGCLVPVGAPDAMADAILATMSEPPSRMELIERAKQFSLEQAIADYEAVMAR